MVKLYEWSDEKINISDEEALIEEPDEHGEKVQDKPDEHGEKVQDEPDEHGENGQDLVPEVSEKKRLKRRVELI